MKKEIFRQKGLTVVELTIAIAIALILFMTIAVVLSSSQRSWNQMYDRITNSVMTDAYMARVAFNATCRKASRSWVPPKVGSSGEYIEIFYYEPWDASQLNSYSRFEIQERAFVREYGSYNLAEGTKSNIATQTIIDSVEAVNFSVVGDSIKMILQLDDGSEDMTITCSAVAHNE